MEQQDKGKVITALLGMAEVFNEPMTNKRVEGYLAALDPLDANQALMAMRVCLRGSKFFPKPAELLETARSNTRGLPSAEEAEINDTPKQREAAFQHIDDYKRKKGWT